MQNVCVCVCLCVCVCATYTSVTNNILIFATSQKGITQSAELVTVTDSAAYASYEKAHM